MPSPFRGQDSVLQLHLPPRVVPRPVAGTWHWATSVSSQTISVMVGSWDSFWATLPRCCGIVQAGGSVHQLWWLHTDALSAWPLASGLLANTRLQFRCRKPPHHGDGHMAPLCCPTALGLLPVAHVRFSALSDQSVFNCAEPWEHLSFSHYSPEASCALSRHSHVFQLRSYPRSLVTHLDWGCGNLRTQD